MAGPGPGAGAIRGGSDGGQNVASGRLDAARLPSAVAAAGPAGSRLSPAGLSRHWRKSPPAGIVSRPRALSQSLCLRGLALADRRWRDRPLRKLRPFVSSHRPTRIMCPSESARSLPRLQFAGAGRITGWGAYLRQPQPDHEGSFLQGVCAFGSAAAGAAFGMLLRAEPREWAEPRGERVERDDAPVPACLAGWDLWRGPP